MKRMQEYKKEFSTTSGLETACTLSIVGRVFEKPWNFPALEYGACSACTFSSSQNTTVVDSTLSNYLGCFETIFIA